MRAAQIRLFLVTILVLALLAALPAAAQDAQDAPFPVTIEHKFGSTTLTEAPERVVVVGFSEQDAALALGITPVAARYWYGDTQDATFPWADALVNGEEPVVLNMDYGHLNYEAILALDPDVVVALYSGITEDEYNMLSQIAPTIAQPAEFIDFGVPWQTTTRIIGQALGKAEEADSLVSEVEAQFADARAQHPQFEGKTLAVVYSYGGGRYGFYTDQDPRARFFADLGFVVPDELVEIAGDQFYADVSTERLGLLDQDLIVFVGLQFFEGGRSAIESDPILSQLDAVKEGRALYIPAELDDALQFNTVLSLSYLLDGILPSLEAIFGAEAEATPDAG